MTKSPKSPSYYYLRYSTAGLEFLIIILLFVAIGYKLDQWKNMETPWFTVVFSLFGSAAAIYRLIKSLSKIE